MVATLSEVEFDLTWEALGLAERPYPLDVPSFGHTTDERARLRAEVAAALTARGLRTGEDLDRDLEDQLLLLARPDYSLDCLLSVGADLKVVGAGAGSRTALAVQHGGQIRVGAAGRGGVAAEVAGMLVDLPAGPGNPVTLRKADFTAAVEAYAATGFGGLEHALNRAGVSGRDMRTVTTLVQSPRSGGGQAAANAVDRVGRRTRTPVLNWFDAEPGRYAVQAQVHGGEEWLAIAPVDTAVLAGRLQQLVDGVRR
ncbi:ESX secretion-associated protein EspG [Actinokineospora bangkokensis]|uniref:ESX secretion-associated protein EspG n=1 Tax=Actinokineospora bangkokensis TaxID=1193682 RepID=A0A1Q9LH97_9PSEU|nr:ESX secretion-associated protein EspG [Actinokineospora bangkokensis]OLR91422.1 hypothetical protein BJP25_00860 [Actinokineospora bangkokensis]